jgi:cyclohexyl-isocyanide hydratase
VALQIGFLLFPRVQPLDLTGAYDVLASMADTKVRLISKTRDCITSNTGLVMRSDTSFEGCPPLDVLGVPGGDGVSDLITDHETLAFLRHHAAHARYISPICANARLVHEAAARL